MLQPAERRKLLSRCRKGACGSPIARVLALLLVTLCLFWLACFSVLRTFPGRTRGLQVFCGDAEEDAGPALDDLSGLQEEEAFFASLDPDFKQRESDLAIYSLQGDTAWNQRVWEFRNVCFNGSNLVVLGNQTCRHGTSFYSDGPVVPVPCNFSKWRDHQDARETGFGPVATRPMEWVTDRTITWRYGTSCLINLERATTNVAHLHSRVNMLLLMNLATVPAFSDVISRFLFRIAPEGIGQYLEPEVLSVKNRHPYHATYLAEVLSMVNIRALEGRRLKASDILGIQATAFGRVEFGGAMAGASEDRPVCFQKALVPGILKASYWPGGLLLANEMRQRLYRHAAPSIQQPLEPPSAPIFNSSIHILYIVRQKTGTFKRRQFDPASQRAMLFAVASAGLYWRAVELVGMDFWQQVALMKDADITISLHGANLLNPSLLQRRDTVLMELIPFHVVHHMYEEQAMATGLVYIGMRLEQGSVQHLDPLYANLTSHECMGQPLCKMYHVHNRTVEITAADAERIGVWLLLARALVQNLQALRSRSIWDAVVWEEVANGIVGFPRLKECGSAQAMRRSRKLGAAWMTYRDHESITTCTWGEPRESHFPSGIHSVVPG